MEFLKGLSYCKAPRRAARRYMVTRGEVPPPPSSWQDCMAGRGLKNKTKIFLFVAARQVSLGKIFHFLLDPSPGHAQGPR
jgi:hypothetical protein